MSDDGVCVLIAEDEVLIASMIEAVLADEGLDTKVVSTGGEAVAALREKPSGFQVLVTDIRLGSPPEGWEVAHVARKAIRPSVSSTSRATAWTSGARMVCRKAC